MTTRNNSLVVGVGNDYDNAIARTLGTGQTLVHQYLTSVGDTYWVQRRTSPTPVERHDRHHQRHGAHDRPIQLEHLRNSAATGPQTWNMSGTVSPAAGGSGTSLFIAGALLTTTADASGNFNFAGLPNGTYTVTPQKSGYTFSPPNRSVTINGADVTGVNFTAQALLPTTFNMSGTVSPAAGGSGTFPSLVIAGALLTTTADSSGNFNFAGVPNGTYTVTPSKSGYTFTPPNRSVTINGADVTGVNFTAQAVPTTFDVSGTVSPAAGGSGTSLVIGGALLTTTADGSGNFNFTGVPNGTYTVTPSKYGYAFTPPNRSVTINGANVTGVNFTAQAVPTSFSITGTITPASDSVGTRITLGEQGDVFVDSNGNYTLNGVPNGTFTVVPFKAGFTITPITPGGNVVTVNGANVTGVNFTMHSDRAVEWALRPGRRGRQHGHAAHRQGADVFRLVHHRRLRARVGSGHGPADPRAEPVLQPVLLGPLATGRRPHPGRGRLRPEHHRRGQRQHLRSGHACPGRRCRTWSYRRWYPTSTTLPDGRASITSGAQTCLTCLADVPEIFDPATNTFTKMTTARLAIPYYPFIFVLPDGKIVNAGANEDPAPTSTLDMTTKTWTTVDPNVKDGHSSAMYQPGKIIKSGTATDSGTSGIGRRNGVRAST